MFFYPFFFLADWTNNERWLNEKTSEKKDGHHIFKSYLARGIFEEGRRAYSADTLPNFFLEHHMSSWMQLHGRGGLSKENERLMESVFSMEILLLMMK